MRNLVTGHAGFIGFNLARQLLRRGDAVVGFDSVNDYYDVTLKRARLAELQAEADRLGADYTSIEADLTDRDVVNRCFSEHQFDRVIHLAAQAGVRHSLTHPHDYIESNIVGFTTLLEACRHASVPHLTYASTSSVYGANRTMPFSESHGVDHPLQLYAATKRANELMAHSYSHLFGLPTTGLRFFTVYGPWGRPDMALFIFTKNIINGEPIEVFNHGNHSRDFTFVDDIVEGIVRCSDSIAKPDPAWDPQAPNPATSNCPFRIYNIGNSSPVKLSDYIAAIEDAVGRKAVKNLRSLQPGDVPDSFASTEALARDVGYQPKTSVKDGVKAFVDWYRSYYGV